MKTTNLYLNIFIFMFLCYDIVKKFQAHAVYIDKGRFQIIFKQYMCRFTLGG